MATAELEATAKAIRDLDELVGLLVTGLSRAKPWQRELASHAAVIQQRLQVLRMTVVMERNADEIRAAAEALHTACRRTTLAVNGSRADITAKATARLIAALANRIDTALSASKSADFQQPPSDERVTGDR
ncbi:MAG: hypothetical protein V3V71_04920 [Roseateles sp.]|jgi:hypothetical protein|nr:hypothetical protein [Burkholderiaceae bacterium]